MQHRERRVDHRQMHAERLGEQRGHIDVEPLRPAVVAKRHRRIREIRGHAQRPGALDASDRGSGTADVGRRRQRRDRRDWVPHDAKASTAVTSASPRPPRRHADRSVRAAPGNARRTASSNDLPRACLGMSPSNQGLMVLARRTRTLLPRVRSPDRTRPPLPPTRSQMRTGLPVDRIASIIRPGPLR